MTAHDGFGAIDPDEVGDDRASRSSRRRWLVPTALVGALGLGGGGAWLAMRDDGSSATPSTAEFTPAGDEVEFDGGAGGTDASSGPTAHLVVGALPDDLAVFQAFDADSTSDDDLDTPGPTASAVLLAEPGATASTGGTVMISVSEYDDSFLSEETGPDSIVVGDTSWYVYDVGDDSGMMNVTFPIDERWNVDLTTRHRSRAELAAIANSIAVDDDGSIVFRDGSLIDGYEEVIDGDAVLAMTTGSITNSSLIMYSTPGGDFTESLNLSVTAMPPTDFAPVYRLFVDDMVDLTVHDLPAIGGANDQAFGGEAIIVWQEDGNLITLSGSYGVDELLPIAESVRAATDEEWADALAAFDPSVFDPGIGLDDSHFVVGAGDIGERRTWIVEASFDDGVELCSNTDNYSACATAADDEVDATHPILQTVASSDDGTIGTVIAVVDRSVIGAVLRITPTDGEPVLIPLHEVDASFPGPAAAGAYLAAMGGTADLLDAEGAVLDTISLSAVG